mmetsp:Transcript_10456/g.23195  ORF Transcript_10456/g.23195 Transcript_10456/m.23195 type:complete len:225 (-) Transcript_10456:253-927(-)
MSIVKVNVADVLCPSVKHMLSTMTEMQSNKTGAHYFVCPQDNDSGEPCSVIGFRCNKAHVNCCVALDVVMFKHETAPAAHQKKSSIYVCFECYNIPRPQLKSKKTSPCPVCKQNILVNTDIVPCDEDSTNAGRFKHLLCPPAPAVLPTTLTREEMQRAAAEGARPSSPLSFEEFLGVKQTRKQNASIDSQETPPSKKSKSHDSQSPSGSQSHSQQSLSQDGSSK